MSDRAYLATLMAACAVLVGVIVWVVLFATAPPRSAHQEEVPAGEEGRLERIEHQLEELLSATSGGGGEGAVSARRRTPTQPPEGEILVVWTDQELPVAEPQNPAWDAAPVTTVPLQVQDQTMPTLDEITVSEVRVQGLTNGRQIAWRIRWQDTSPEWFMDTDRFCDAVAIQWPLVANATYKMGDREFPVQVLQWKALWQKDIDEHFQDVQDLHPNYWADLYWFAEGEFPQRVPEDFTATEALDYFVAYRAGNPVAELERKQPVQELFAEGFGTLTIQSDSVSVARGVHENGEWTVVFGRPLETNDVTDYQFEPGKKDVVAFAVWDGSSENVSGRKHHSQWVVFEVQR